MKKIIKQIVGLLVVLYLLIPHVLWAEVEGIASPEVEGLSASTVEGQSIGGSSCVTTNVVFWWRLSSEDDPAGDFSATNGTDDYSVGDDVADSFTSTEGSSYGNSAVYSSPWGFNVNGASDYIKFASPTSTLDEAGKIGMWVYFNSHTTQVGFFRVYYNDTNVVQLLVNTNGTIRLGWQDNGGGWQNCDSTATISDSTWYFIEGDWNTTNDTQHVTIDGGTPKSCTESIDPFASDPTFIYFGNSSASVTDASYNLDNPIISSDDTDDLETYCSVEESYP